MKRDNSGHRELHIGLSSTDVLCLVGDPVVITVC